MRRTKRKNITTLYKIVITSALCAVAFAADLPAYKLSALYHPTPVYKGKEISPQILDYEHGVTEDNVQNIDIHYDNKFAGSFNPLKSPITSTTRDTTTATTTRNNISIQQKQVTGNIQVT